MVQCSVKATFQNLRGSVEKLSPKESVEGAHTALGQCEGFQRIFHGQTRGYKTKGAQLANEASPHTAP